MTRGRVFTAQDIADWHNDMTLGRATELLRPPFWACACVGPPYPSPVGTPCFCQLSANQARRLRRGAHIVAKLLLSAGSLQHRKGPQ